MNTDQTKYLYGLYEPGTDGRLRYIGMTINPANRFHTHCSDRIKKKRLVVAWIRKLKARGQKPVMKIIAKITMPGNLSGNEFYSLPRLIEALAIDMGNLRGYAENDRLLNSQSPADSMFRMGAISERPGLALGKKPTIAKATR